LFYGALQLLDRTTFGWSLELALAGRASEKIPRLARLGLFFSWSGVEAGVFYDVVLSALVLVLARSPQARLAWQSVPA
jgi:hypothetical protein